MERKLPDKGVTSLAEVWIEILDGGTTWAVDKVTSLAEVWIEITKIGKTLAVALVTSLAEVWIEIVSVFKNRPNSSCHFHCGSVD